MPGDACSRRDSTSKAGPPPRGSPRSARPHRQRAHRPHPGPAGDGVPGRVGGGRDLQPQVHALVRPLLLLLEGRPGPDQGRGVAQRRAPPEVQAPGRHEGAGPRADPRLRAARRLPDLGAGAGAPGQRLAAAGLRGAQGEAGQGGPLRPRAQAPAPPASPPDRGGDVAPGCRDPRHPAGAARALRQPRGGHLPGGGAGTGGGGPGGGGDPRPQPAGRPRRADRGPRRGQPRGPVALQRRAGRAGPGLFGHPHDLRGGPRDRLHHRRLRGRPARAHPLGGGRAGGAGQGRPGGAGRLPSSGTCTRGCACA